MIEEILKPMSTAPRDGTEVILLTRYGIVSAHFCPGEMTTTMDGDEYEGPVWSCYDDAIQIEVEEFVNEIGHLEWHDEGCIGWFTFPKNIKAAQERHEAKLREEWNEMARQDSIVDRPIPGSSTTVWLEKKNKQ